MDPSEDVLADEPLIIGDEPSTADLPAQPVDLDGMCDERGRHPATDVDGTLNQ